uniref:Uncharacterized protein n=1 Tax=viral metagenome TaxID=1070528 RepID=A0A6M3LMT3_9ZZZZ
MKDILNKITGSVIGTIGLENNDGSLWGIIFFLIILLGVIVATTSLKSAKIKELEDEIKELKNKKCQENI